MTQAIREIRERRLSWLEYRHPYRIKLERYPRDWGRVWHRRGCVPRWFLLYRKRGVA